MTLNNSILIHINKIYIMAVIKKKCAFVTNEKIHQKFCVNSQWLNTVLAILPNATPPLCTVGWSAKTNFFLLTGTAYLPSPSNPPYH